jgi:hypothetical protein
VIVRITVATDDKTIAQYAVATDPQGEPVAMCPGREMDLPGLLTDLDAVIRGALAQ